jgi:tetratricopeptide (TPR) repeat protein
MPKRSEHLGDPSLKSDQSAEDLLLQGLLEHQEGRLSQAAHIYQAILDSTPDHFDALQLLGTIALQVKKHEQAADLLKRAIGVRQDFPQTHNNLGIALQELGQLDQAIEHFYSSWKITSPEC